MLDLETAASHTTALDPHGQLSSQSFDHAAWAPGNDAPANLAFAENSGHFPKAFMRCLLARFHLHAAAGSVVTLPRALLVV